MSQVESVEPAPLRYFCHYCGYVVPTRQKRCPRCGERVRQAAQRRSPNPHIRIAIVGLRCFISAGAGIIVLLHDTGCWGWFFLTYVLLAISAAIGLWSLVPGGRVLAICTFVVDIAGGFALAMVTGYWLSIPGGILTDIIALWWLTRPYVIAVFEPKYGALLQRTLAIRVEEADAPPIPARRGSPTDEEEFA